MAAKSTAMQRFEIVTRWARFAGVGLMGFCVQLATLHLLTTFTGLSDLIAVLASVEAAILHNFIWHERWTWRDRLTRPQAWAGRLVRFNVSTGAVSLVGNAILTIVFAWAGELPVVAANVVAVVCLTVVNFFVADRLTFRARAAAPRPHEVSNGLQVMTLEVR